MRIADPTHTTDGSRIDLMAELRQRAGDVVDPSDPHLGAVLDNALSAVAFNAGVSHHLPTGKVRVQVLRRGTHAELDTLPDNVYSVLRVVVPVRCAHPTKRTP